jgi:hypothetical protein
MAALKNILHQEIELLPGHFDKLEPKGRLEFYRNCFLLHFQKLNQIAIKLLMVE